MHGPQRIIRGASSLILCLSFLPSFSLAFVMPSSSLRVPTVTPTAVAATTTSSPLFRPPSHSPLFSRRRHQHCHQTITKAAAATSAGSPASATYPSSILERVKTMGKGLAAGLPVVAFSTISGGVLAGSLHAVTGPDHLAALLPRCIGKRWYQAMRIGAVWGLGHGISAILMGMVAFFLKGRLSSYSHSTLIPKLSLYTEMLIGISLIVIGLLGLKEAAHFEASALQPEGRGASGAAVVAKEASSKAVFLNGLLHGFSWDGTPTLAPALAFDSWMPVMTFLCSYGLGTMLSMSTATSLIGEGTVKVGQAFDKPNIPKKLAQGSSVLAIVIGLVWTCKALL